MERKLLIYDSFTTEVFKGNPAGVLLGADGLKNEEMQNIARELGYPETVFLFLNDPEKIKVKFFTPKEEIDLCGHATIAYETALVECGIIKVEEGENQVNIETNLGTLPIVIKIRNNEAVFQHLYYFCFIKGITVLGDETVVVLPLYAKTQPCISSAR